MRKQVKMENNKNKLSVQEYITEHNKTGDCLYVLNIANCNEADAEYILLVESPHKEEIKKSIPLVGNTGLSVSKFLLGKTKTPFGELVKNNDSSLNGKNIAIVNVCNIPLQIIDKNKNIVNENDLKKFREENKIDESLKKHLYESLNKYTSAKVIVICGTFAKTYYESIKNKITVTDLKELYVPHPSYNHWDFIFEHKDDISILKWLFK